MLALLRRLYVLDMFKRVMRLGEELKTPGRCGAPVALTLAYCDQTISEALLQTLESYLNDGIHRDREEIAALERVLRETGETIINTFEKDREDWPYEVRRGIASGTHSYSQSTSAMMIDAIDALLESPRQGGRRAAYSFDLSKGLAGQLHEDREAAFVKLVADISATRRKRRKIGDCAVVTQSGTFGFNDPLTLSFLAEILPAETPKALRRLKDHAIRNAKRLLAVDPAKELYPAKETDNAFVFREKDPQKSTPLANAFVPLRILRAAQVLRVEITDYQTARYLRYFESTLHDQLSYSLIPDSRFDPAELIFCLEGLVRLSPQSVDAPLFERVLEVLEAAQKTSAHWRPTKPFLRNERGLVLFPVSVEAANSLLWTCKQLDETDERFHRFSERSIELFRRFWDWLAARRVRIDDRISGWHSEHIADPDSIQLWDTAQVVSFLLGFRRGLYNHIARTTLRLARFDVRQPVPAAQSWSPATRAGQLRRRTVPKSDADDKSALRAGFEPATSLGAYFETYEKIERAFLVDWLDGDQTNYSMLLYGPPGTGKTSVAENLADSLGFRMITITVSDFLAEGSGGVEARAKMIFEVLQAQADCVILFDEIDELVLDRSSPRHEMQDTVFKFMTPGMLTKLNNLRSAKRSIFILATNFVYRIDPAIRRTGRIDENYLLLPPDAGARKRMLQGFLTKADKGHALHPDSLSNAEWEALQEASFFLGYKDIEAAVSRVLRLAPARKTVATLKRELVEWGRTTTLQLYDRELKEPYGREAIEREFLPLVEMARCEGSALAGKPVLSNDSLYEGDMEDRIYADEADRDRMAREFVKQFSPEYDRS